MSSFPILSLMLLVPLAGAIACLMSRAQTARIIALAATLIDLALGVMLWANYDIGGAQWQFTERADLFAGMQWALGIDGIEREDPFIDQWGATALLGLRYSL